MAEYSKEFSKMKGAAASQLKDLIAGIKSGAIQMSGNEPKMSLRALRTLLLSEDKVHGELVEQFLSGKLNVEQFKNKLRSAGETKIPKPLRRLPTDRIHHGTPLEIGNILQEMPDEQLRRVLTELGDEGYFFGDTDANVRGGSFDERAHTGARPKASTSKIVYPNTVGEPGLREVSAHPRGTRDKLFDIDARPTTAEEAKGVIRPLLEQGKDDFQRGVIADTPRRNYINQQLVEKGIIEQGVDIFSADIDDATLKRARPFLQSDALQEGAAKAFKTPTIGMFRQQANLKRASRQVASKAPPLLGGLALATGTLIAGGSPGQAFEAFVETENPLEDFDAGPVFDEKEDYAKVIQDAETQNKRPLSERLNEGALGMFGRAVRGILDRANQNKSSESFLSGSMK